MFGAVAAILPTGGNEEVQRERTRGTLIASAEPLRTEPMRSAISLQGHSLTRKDKGLGVDNTVGESFCYLQPHRPKMHSLGHD